MPQGSGKKRVEIVACLSALNEGDDISLLSQFCPLDEEKVLVARVEEIHTLPKEERVGFVADRIRSLVARESFVVLSDIHPAWLLEVLSEESPRIIGVVLRYLPSKHVRYIIEHLPKRIKHRLPSMLDAFAVPAPILSIIRERFERRFQAVSLPKELQEFHFGHLAFLKGSDLEVIFRDIGMQELAMALKGVDRRSLNILFNRLTLAEARALQQRIRSLIDMSQFLLRDAKYTVLEMNLTEAESNDLLMDIGLNAFARSLDDKDIEIFSLIQQKLEPRLGYTLKRYIDQHITSNFPRMTEKRKSVILERVALLAKSGAVDPELARYFASSSAEKTVLMDTAPEAVAIHKEVAEDQERPVIQ